MELNKDAENIIDVLKITPKQMRKFLNDCHTRHRKDEAEFILWLHERMESDEVFKKCVLLSATIGSAVAFAKIGNATEEFLNHIEGH